MKRGAQKVAEEPRRTKVKTNFPLVPRYTTLGQVFVAGSNEAGQLGIGTSSVVGLFNNL